MDPPSTSTPGTAGAGGGHIHFVTPTNRWLGSIPLSTLDPLTLEPLSTYVRPDPPEKTKTAGGVGGEEALELDGEEEVEDMKERTTNIAGDPISLILARLQTNPQGCACGCTVPDPPKHSDYYHAQHLLRLLFQTQRVRSRSLKMYLPEFFEQFGQDEEDESSEDEGDDSQDEQEQDWERERQGGQRYPRDAIVIPMENSNNCNVSNLAPQPLQSRCQQPPLPTKRPKKIPRYVHSLVQNRNFRNPLTNTDIQGEATFFAVLEPGRGGWWHEPWAVAMQRPKGVEGFHSLLHRQQSSSHSKKGEHEEGEDVNEKGGEDRGEEKKTPEMIQLEKELRKERWRQGRIVNLELEAQHEMDWRRWNRSQATYAAEAEAQAEVDKDFTHLGTKADGQSNVWRRRGGGRKLMRLKLGKDIALLEPSERGLRLPRRVRSPSDSSGFKIFDRGEKKTNALSVSTKTGVVGVTSVTNNPVGDLYRSVQASAVLNDVELEEIRQQQKKQEQEQEVPEKAQQYMQGRRGPHRRVANKCRRRLARVHRATAPSSPLSAPTTTPSEGATPGFSFLPWWDPDPRPFQMPTTKLSPFAISTLPEPVAKLFGGTSIYSHTSQPSKSNATATTNNVGEDGSSSSTTANNTDPSPPPGAATTTPTKNTAGCQWVPVKRGDRVAVMIGTSKDFLLFPSFQRLLFRHLSREDFEDRVARVHRIPCPATAIVVTNTSGEGAVRSVQQQMREQGDRMQQELFQRQQSQQEEEQGEGSGRDIAALEEGEGSAANTTTTGRGRAWMSWMSPRRRQDGTRADSNSTPVNITTRTVDTTAIGPELGVRLPLPPSSESTTAFVDGSNSSSSSSSSANSSCGRSSGEEEMKRGHVDDEKYGRQVEETDRIPSNNNQRVDIIDEKAVTAAALDSAITTTNNNLLSSTKTAQGTRTNKESPEEKAQRWQILEERFLREDYDSSEYSYASSSDEEEDELPLDYDGPYYSSEESGSSDDDGGGSDDDNGARGRRGGGNEAATERRRWGILDWIHFITFCTPHPRTLATSDSLGTGRSASTGTGGGGVFESRRARRRRLRRERWQRIQQRQREQESESLHRYLPATIRRRMTAQDVHRCCMVAEFCRFYLTILMALFLMGAIVYGAVHAESSPPPSPKPSQAQWQGQVKDVVTMGGGGGGSLRRVPAGQWTSNAEVQALGASGGGEAKGDGGGQPQQQQQPLGTIAVQ